LAGAGKGVALMKLAERDRLVGAKVLREKSDVLTVVNEKGTTFDITLRRYAAVSRAGKGHALFKRGKLVGMVDEEPSVPELEEPAAKGPRPGKGEN
jgi:DNA gyrase/topoisomerase IV subunit A